MFNQHSSISELENHSPFLNHYPHKRAKISKFFFKFTPLPSSCEFYLSICLLFSISLTNHQRKPKTLNKKRTKTPEEDKEKNLETRKEVGKGKNNSSS